MKVWSFPIIKAAMVGFGAFQIVSSVHLDDLDKSLLVALLSGLLGIIAVIVGQAIAGHQAREVLEAARHNSEVLQRLEALTNAQIKQLDTQTTQLDTITEQTNGEEHPK